MFGIVKPQNNIDDTVFKKYYCGVCKSIAKNYTPFSRLALSYDCTFLAIILNSLLNENKNEITVRCVGRKKQIYTSDIIDLCADINVILMYKKLVDDENDDKNIKSSIGKNMMEKAYLKAKSKHNEIDKSISANLDYLYTLEKNKCDDIDEISCSFGELLKSIGKLIYNDENFCEMLFNIGRYIYIVDAVMDYHDDIKKDKYNPYYIKYGKREDILPMAKFNIEYTIAMVYDYYQKLNITNNKDLLDNIIYKGLTQYFN